MQNKIKKPIAFTDINFWVTNVGDNYLTKKIKIQVIDNFLKYAENNKGYKRRKNEHKTANI